MQRGAGGPPARAAAGGRVHARGATRPLPGTDWGVSWLVSLDVVVWGFLVRVRVRVGRGGIRGGSTVMLRKM